MNITLNQNEILDALEQYVGDQGINLENKDVSINLMAGRGPNGYSATVSITTPATTTKKKRGRPSKASVEDISQLSLPLPPENFSDESSKEDTSVPNVNIFDRN